MSGGLNGNKTLAALLISVNVMLAGAMAAWVNSRLNSLDDRVMAMTASVAGIKSRLETKIESADKEHSAFDRRLDKLESRGAR